MEQVGAYIILIYIAGTLLGFGHLRWNLSSKHWIAPTLVDRALTYALCNGIACVVMMLIIQSGNSLYTHWTGNTVAYRQHQALTIALVLLAPVPLAVWLTAVTLRRLRATAVEAARASAVHDRRTGFRPPLRLKPGTALPTTFRSQDFSRIDTNDDEVIREVARSHWQAINDTAASHGDIAPMLAAQARFLESHAASLPAEQAAHVHRIYEEASIPHAAELSRIADAQSTQAEELQARRNQRLKNTRWTVLLLSGVIIGAIILKVIRLLS